MQKLSISFAILTSFLVIVFLIQPLSQFVAVEANPFSHPQIEIISPVESNREIYQNTSIPILIESELKINNISYSLDDNPNRTLRVTVTNSKTSVTYSGNEILYNLTNGLHSVKAYATDTQDKVLSASTTFLVNTTFSYPTFVISPMNVTYKTNEIPLTFNIDLSKFIVAYNLDNSYSGGLTRVYDNVTLSVLSIGQHTITVKAVSRDANFQIYSKQTANFTIDTINPTINNSVSQSDFLSHNAFSIIMLSAFGLILITLMTVLSRRRRKVSDGYD
jgi:hypothetical protein